MRDQASVHLYHAFQDWRVRLDGNLPQVEPPVLRQLLTEMEQAINHIKDELQQPPH